MVGPETPTLDVLFIGLVFSIVGHASLSGYIICWLCTMLREVELYCVLIML